MIGYESQVVNGQLVNVAPSAAFDPIAFGPIFTGPTWNRQGVYTIPPVTPSAASMAATFGSDSGLGQSGAVYPTATSESGNPFHMTKSPLWWALGFFALSLLLLHFIHYKN